MKRQLSSALRRGLYFALLSVSLLSISRANAAEAVNDDPVLIGTAGLLSDSDMDESRGSGGTLNIANVSSEQNMTATSSGNTVKVNGNLMTGNIGIGDNFGGSGFGSYVMNSGNNATINSGVTLSVLMMQ